MAGRGIGGVWVRESESMRVKGGGGVNLCVPEDFSKRKLAAGEGGGL